MQDKEAKPYPRSNPELHCTALYCHDRECRMGLQPPLHFNATTENAGWDSSLHCNATTENAGWDSSLHCNALPATNQLQCHN